MCSIEAEMHQLGIAAITHDGRGQQGLWFAFGEVGKEAMEPLCKLSRRQHAPHHGDVQRDGDANATSA